MITFRTAILFSLLSIGASQWARAESDWLQFRGNDAQSRTHYDLPTHFGGDDELNITWKAAMPGRAVNGPIVVRNQVITTASSGHQQRRLHVISVDRETGEIQWQRRFWATGRTLCHPLSAMAAPTPSSDGERIFALFASNDLACLDLDGNLLWIRSLAVEYPNSFDDRGLASSTWLIDGTLIVQIACSGDSFVLGVDAGAGNTLWKVPLAKTTNWATPCSIQIDGETLAVVQSAERLLLLEPKTGQVRCSHEAEGNLIPSPAVQGTTVLLPADGLTALTIDPGVRKAEVRWSEAKVGAESASPVIAGDHFYVIRPPSILTAASMDDGSVTWKTRLEGNGFWATPLLTDTHIYVANSDGLVQVVDLEDGNLVAKNELGEEILGSPAAADDALYLRGTSTLFKVEAGDGQPQ